MDHPAQNDVIRLDQFLKLQGVAATGGQAKILVHEGSVRVNGEIETRRGRKLHVGDVVVVNDQEFLVQADV